jgi:DNA replication protein DnaC
MNTFQVIQNEPLNIPLRYRDLHFDDFRIDNDEQKYIRYLAECFVSYFPKISQQGRSLIFHGAPGTGKTMLAMIMYQALIEQGHAVCYESAFLFFNHLEKKLLRADFILQDVLNYYQHFSLLIIDHLTDGAGLKETLTRNEQQMLFTIIDHRYQHCLSTMLISNHSKEELTEIIGGALMDRLSDDGLILTFNWDSYRNHS